MARIATLTGLYVAALAFITNAYSLILLLG